MKKVCYTLFLIFAWPVLACEFASPVLLFDDRKNQYEILVDNFSEEKISCQVLNSDKEIRAIIDLNYPDMVRFGLGKWEQNTTYQYVLTSGGCVSDTFSFKTFPHKNFASLTIMAGSCLSIDSNEYIPMLDSILNRKPDLMVWLGDNLYFTKHDLSAHKRMRARYRMQRKHPQLAKILASIPSIAIHDDHDYGPNDGDSTFLMKYFSNKLFQSYWYSSSMLKNTENETSLFSTYKLGTFNFILTDNRSHRGVSSDTLSPVFGEKQLKRIEASLNSGLRYSNILLSGGQILNPAANYENLSRYPGEYKKVMKLLNGSGATLILSGDRHHGEICESGSLMEVTASPINSKLYTTDERNPLRTRGPIDTYNVALIRFNASNLGNVEAQIEFIITAPPARVPSLKTFTF